MGAAAASAIAWPPNLLALGWQQLPCAKGTVIFNTTILSPATTSILHSSSTSSSSRNHHTTQGFTLDAKFFYDCLIWEFCIVIANTTTPFANICCFSCHSVIMRSFCSKILLMCLLKMWSLKVSQ